jgi:hypothetical protein
VPIKKGRSQRVGSKPKNKKAAPRQASIAAYEKAGRSLKPKGAAEGGEMKKPKGAVMMVKRRDADQKTAIY